MISGVRNSLSALQAFQTRQNATADNVANVNTEDYKKTEVTLDGGQNDSVRVRTEKVDTPGPLVSEETGRGSELVEKSNVELSEELPESMLNKRHFEANVKMIEQADEMTGALLDIVS
ncbi:MAG: flagellar basal body rod C-terminal domain-containing protein [Desulfurivibrionaceae bacterium]